MGLVTRFGFPVWMVVVGLGLVSWRSDAAQGMAPRTRYEPNWASLDQRPLPRWYDEAKVGIFLHYGVYSVPSFGSEWFWHNWLNLRTPEYIQFMQRNYKPDFTYQEFADEFTAELFNATQWALLFKDSGARYVVLTSKHHDGFTLWPSKHSFSWNSMDVGPKRDIVKELAAAVRGVSDLKFGLYYSLFEWFNRLWIDDKLHLLMQQHFVDQKVRPEQLDLVQEYLPEIIWSDGDWEAPAKYWKSEQFIAWLYNDSPVRDTVVTNDRWGMGTACKHGDFYNCADRFNPGVLQSHKWENAFTLERSSWGQRFDVSLSNFMSTKDLIKEIVTTVSCNGNVLINVGPTKYGTILPIFEERLRDMGRWLKINGEGIYGSVPWIYQNDTETPNVWYTRGQQAESNSSIAIYAFVLDYPYDTNELDIHPLGKEVTISRNVHLTGLDFGTNGEVLTKQTTKVVMLGMGNTKVQWTSSHNKLHVKFPPKNHMDKRGLDYAWTLKITIA
ncbi:putative alpha-L-fucosidase [Drosophila pseudoobscura]|uniref:Putative alpha-L-fucosidase n=1 Tax=Drosophila pseudoobscura pseudoobscura TaxID=46245 RepID=A0A6I8V0U0_DROPS|nr:putative alpha-L-fucosidase [Drosophila pseudoobscura]